LLQSSWANVDGRLGIVVISGSGMAYAQASNYSPGISVYTDILYGSYSTQLRQFKAGDQVARRVAIFFVEVTPKKTSELAKSCRIETTAGGKELRFKQPDGSDASVALF
jgi:hypothetical protein